MKKTFLLFIVGFVLNSGFAQQILDIEADLIGIDYPYQLSFYKKNSKGSYDKTVIHNHFKETIHFTQIATHDEVIDVETLRKQSANKLLRQLKNGVYLNQTKNAHYLSLENNGFVKIINYKETNKIPKWDYNFHLYFNYSLIQINGKYSIIYLLSNRFERYFGFLLPRKENTILSFSTNGDFPLEKNHEFQKVHRRLFAANVLDTLPTPLNLKFKLMKNHQLADYFSQEIVLDKNLDTLYMRNGFIIGLQNHKTLIYNQKLENITPKNLRVMEFMESTGRYDYSYPQVLVENEVQWLSHNGELFRNDEITFNCNYYNRWSLASDFIKITQKNGELWIKDALLSKDNVYENAWFLNKKEILDTYNSYKINLYENYLIVRKNGKYGLIKYVFNEERTKLKTQLILPIEYDFIYPMLFNPEEQRLILENNKLFGLLLLKTEKPLIKTPLSNEELSLPIEYDDIKYLGKCQPFLLKKNQLYGYSGIQEKAKYKKLERFHFNFARFILPNGKKGWLDRDGMEYLDE